MNNSVYCAKIISCIKSKVKKGIETIDTTLDNKKESWPYQAYVLISKAIYIKKKSFIYF